MKIPYPIQLFKATNGYIIKAGCSTFVREGSTFTVLDDVKQYLEDKFDEYLKRYNIAPDLAYYTEHPQEEPVAEAEEPKEDTSENQLCSAYHNRDLWEIKNQVLITSIYKARNGRIIVNHIDKSVIVEQEYKQ